MMRITAECRRYPLRPDFVGPITGFIHELRALPGIEVVSNQMSTQIRGDFDAVMNAITNASRSCMERVHPVVLVAKILNSDLAIGSPPRV